MIPALLHAERVDACSRSHAEVVAQSRRELCAFAETDPIGRTLRLRIFTSSLAIVHALIAGECCEKRP
jgi:hypothetical protein